MLKYTKCKWPVFELKGEMPIFAKVKPEIKIITI